MIYSNTEFYFAEPKQITDSTINLKDEEVKHLTRVMRHSVGDVIYITDGRGNVFESRISLLSRSNVRLNILKKEFVENKFPNVTLFIPLLKSSDRLEFALEKCVELGITNIKIYSAENSHKRGVKLDRWKKITQAAMKQSLQAYEPHLEFNDSLKIDKSKNVTNIIFDQLAVKYFSDIVLDNKKKVHTNLIFGPEAGLTKKEIISIPNSELVFLTKDRLRTETAIITAISILSTK